MNLSVPIQRVLDCRSFSPSPQPSPAGRGRTAASVRSAGGNRKDERGRCCPLSQRERAGVRENGHEVSNGFNQITLSAPLISTRLQPGVRARAKMETVSTVSVRHARSQTKPAKPLKRLRSLPRHTTGLKPGANERLPAARPVRGDTRVAVGEVSSANETHGCVPQNVRNRAAVEPGGLRTESFNRYAVASDLFVVRGLRSRCSLHPRLLMFGSYGAERPCRRLPAAVGGQQQFERVSTNLRAMRRLEVAGTGARCEGAAFGPWRLPASRMLVGRAVLSPPPSTRSSPDLGGAVRTPRPTSAGSRNANAELGPWNLSEQKRVRKSGLSHC